MHYVSHASAASNTSVKARCSQLRPADETLFDPASTPSISVNVMAIEPHPLINVMTPLQPRPYERLHCRTNAPFLGVPQIGHTCVSVQSNLQLAKRPEYRVAPLQVCLPVVTKSSQACLRAANTLVCCHITQVPKNSSSGRPCHSRSVTLTTYQALNVI